MTGTTGSAGSAKTTSAKSTELPGAVREQVIDSVKQGQEMALGAVQSWVETLGKVVPKIPSLPFAPAGPEMAEAVAAAFDLAEELLTTQRRFASELVSALVPTSA